MHFYITGGTKNDIHENLIYTLGIFSCPNESLGGQQYHLNGFDINEIYVTALYHRDVKWASWHLKSPDNTLFVHANIKAPASLAQSEGNSHTKGGFPQKRQQLQKCIHIMVSS